MARVKAIETVTQTGTAIQFVRAAIGDVYDFLDHRDMSVFFKNDKFSGTIYNERGVLINVTGKDWIVKDETGAITTYTEEQFNALFHIVGE